MDVELARLQRLHQHRAVAVVVVDDGLEIVAADVEREPGAPIVRDALVSDGAARIDLCHAIGAAAERWLHRRLAERAVPVVGLGDDGEPTHDQRQLAVVWIGEMEGNLAIAGGLDPLDAGKLVGEGGMALGGEDFEGERHVAGRDRGAVVPARLGPQEEADAAPVGRKRDALGDQPVGGVRLVCRAFEQALEGQARAGRARALQRERIERAVGIDRGEMEPAALGRIGGHVVEVRKVGAILQVAEERESVGRLLSRRAPDKVRHGRHRRRDGDSRALNEASSAESHRSISS